MKFKNLIFDFDGTLFDTRKDIVFVVNETRKSLGLKELNSSEIITHVGHGLKQLILDTIPEAKDSQDAYEIAGEVYQKFPFQFAEPYSGVIELITNTSCKLAIISNKPQGIIEKILEHFQIKDRFEEIIGGDRFEYKKPDVRTIEFVFRKLGWQKNESVMIGDHDPDILLAKNFGINSVYCNYGFVGDDSIGADFLIENFSEIKKFIS